MRVFLRSIKLVTCRFHFFITKNIGVSIKKLLNLDKSTFRIT